MAEYTAAAVQTVNPGESVIFSEAPVPCRRGLVRHRDESGNFLLSGRPSVNVPCGCRCGCGPTSLVYPVAFGANIAVPTGGTAGEISLAIAIDGGTIPASEMIVTPAAVEQFFNVSRETSAEVWLGCCETVTVRNTSDQPILVSDANIVFGRPNYN